jgi:hypothetical protein
VRVTGAQRLPQDKLLSFELDDDGDQLFIHGTVCELLSPVEERRKVFSTGGRELDRERLGFVSDTLPAGFVTRRA